MRSVVAAFAIAVTSGAAPLTGAFAQAPIPPAPIPPAPISLRVEPVQIGPGALSRGVLGFVSGFELSSDDARFGGLSGLVLRPGGLLAATDKGAFVELNLERDASGRIQRVRGGAIGALRDAAGQALRGGSRDAEALALSSDGSVWAGFERRHRVAQYPALGEASVAEAAQLPTAGLGYNAGIEALAIDAQGALIAIAEEPVEGAPGVLSGWRMIGGKAAAFQIDQLDGFAATGADIGPDGALYLLERRFGFFTGLHMRVRRFSPAALSRLAQASANETFDLGEGEILGRLSGSDVIDNMEAIAVDAAPDGRMILTLVSDDNFSPAQRTLLLQFRAPGL